MYKGNLFLLFLWFILGSIISCLSIGLSEFKVTHIIQQLHLVLILGDAKSEKYRILGKYSMTTRLGI